MNPEQISSPPCEIRSFDSSAELSMTAATDWFELLQMFELGGREPTVALSGGRIAKAFFGDACQLFASEPELIRKVHFFWADERCVPPDHPESNHGIAAEHLLNPLGVPETQVHRIPGELEPSLAASTASRGLVKWTGCDDGEIPTLDLVLLGMGEDGHVASLFPAESDQVMESRDFCRAVTASKPPPQRVTVSYGILQKAENVWVLASGAGKEEALRESLASPNSTPLGRVLYCRSNTRIYTDLSSAGGFGG